MLRLLVLFPVLLAGCSGEAMPALHPLTGTVERDGNPVTTGGLLFQPVGGSVRFTCNASIAADGKFAAQTEEITGTRTTLLPGVPAGVYRVTYHPPGDTQRSDLSVTLPDPVTVTEGGASVALIVPAKPLPPATRPEPGHGREP